MIRNQLPDARPPIVRGGTIPVPPHAGGGSTGAGSTGTSSGPVTVTYPLRADSGEQEVPESGSGQWMHSTASMTSSGAISGSTRTWCENDFSGFHGSVTPVLLDHNGITVWPATLGEAKHQYGVDGEWVPGSSDDRTDTWTNQVPVDALKSATQLHLQQFLDPKSMFLRDLVIVGKALPEIITIIGSL